MSASLTAEDDLGQDLGKPLLKMTEEGYRQLERTFRNELCARNVAEYDNAVDQAMALLRGGRGAAEIEVTLELLGHARAGRFIADHLVTNRYRQF